MPPLNHTARPIARFRFDGRVDIIIPFHGQYEHVSRAIESIMRHTFSNVYHIIVVDDHSKNKDYINTLAKIPNVSAIRTERQQGFAGAMKAGFELSERLNAQRIEQNAPDHPYVVFFQSDCCVENVNWLQSLGETLLNLKDDNVKMVSPRTNNAVNGHPLQENISADAIDDVVIDSDHLSLYCFLCHRELFHNVGGFFQEYPYGFYEDEEFAYRMRKRGYKQAISGRSYVRHEGEVTLRALWRQNPKSQNIMLVENRNRCLSDMKTLR